MWSVEGVEAEVEAAAEVEGAGAGDGAQEPAHRGEAGVRESMGRVLKRGQPPAV